MLDPLEMLSTFSARLSLAKSSPRLFRRLLLHSLRNGFISTPRLHRLLLTPFVSHRLHNIITILKPTHPSLLPLSSSWRPRTQLPPISLHLAAAHLHFHQPRKSTVRIPAQVRIGALLGHFPVGGEHDDAVGALDGGEAVGDGDGGVVAAEEGGESSVDESFRFSVQG